MKKIFLAVAFGAAIGAMTASAQQRSAGPEATDLLDPKILEILVEFGLLETGSVSGLGAAALPEAAAMRAAFEAKFAGEEAVAIEALDCRDGRCGIVVALGKVAPQDLPERLRAVEDWAADASSCGYALAVPGLGEVDVMVKIAIDCGS